MGRVESQYALLATRHGIVNHVMAFAVKNVLSLVHLHVPAVNPCQMMEVLVIIVDTCAGRMSTQTL
jgi:hypothetical protein